MEIEKVTTEPIYSAKSCSLNESVTPLIRIKIKCIDFRESTY